MTQHTAATTTTTDEPPPARSTPVTPTRRQLLVIALGLVVLSTIFGNLGQTLSQMHVPGGAASSISKIASPLAKQGNIESTVRQWSQWNAAKDPADPTWSPGSVVNAWLLVDSLLFVPILSLFLWLFFARRQKKVRDPSSARWYLSARWLVLVYAVADETENLLTWFVVFHGRAYLWLRFVSGVKWAALAVVVAILLASFFPRLSEEPHELGDELLPTVRAMRIPLAIAVLAVVVQVQLPANVAAQLYDVVRSWVSGDRGRTGIYALVGLVLVTAMLIGMVRLVAAREHRRRADDWTWQGTLWRGALTVGLVLVVTRSWWATLAVLIAVVVLGVLGLYVSGAEGALGSVHQAELDRDRLTAPSHGVMQLIVMAPGFGFAILVLRSLQLVAGDGAARAPVWFMFAGLAVSAGGWWLAALGLPPTPIGSAAAPLAAEAAATGSGPSLWDRATRTMTTDREWQTTMAWAALVFVVGGYGVFVGRQALIDPLHTGWTNGSVGIFFAWLLALGLILIAVDQLWWGRPKGLLGSLHLARVPILIVLLVLNLGVSKFDTSNQFHQVRVENADGAKPLPPSAVLAEVARRSTATQAAGRTVVPLFVIASSGGGGRAAYWTVDVLNCLFDEQSPPELKKPISTVSACPLDATDQAAPKPRWSDVLAASGISGGSVGLAMYGSARNPEGTGGDCGGPLPIDAAFRRGLLDPTFASLLFDDAPNSLLRRHAWDDRAVTLEEAMEHVVPTMADGLLASQVVTATGDPATPAGPDVATLPCRDAAAGAAGQPALAPPLLMLNSAAAHDGCRINVAAVDLATPSPRTKAGTKVLKPCRALDAPSLPSGVIGPLDATRDVWEWSCADTPKDDAQDPTGHDLRLSTAALLSARFPIVSPGGALTWCNGASAVDKAAGPTKEAGKSTGGVKNAYAVDGGLVDSSGASPAAELLRWLLVQPRPATAPDVCLQPVVLQIDNGYEATVEPAAPNLGQLQVLTSEQSVQGASAADDARQELADLAASVDCAGDAGLGALPTYLRVVPQSHPGTEAPLGWSLSKASRRDLDRELTQQDNQCALRAAAAWLTADADRACPRDVLDHLGVDDTRVALADPTLPSKGHTGGGVLVGLMVALAVVAFFVGGVHERTILRDRRDKAKAREAEAKALAAVEAAEARG